MLQFLFVVQLVGKFKVIGYVQKSIGQIFGNGIFAAVFRDKFIERIQQQRVFGIDIFLEAQFYGD